jgi:ABC-2 type transport system permease protein
MRLSATNASLRFLLRHELRLAWRRGGLGRLGISFPLAVLLLVVVLHIVAFGLAESLLLLHWTRADLIAATTVGLAYAFGLILAQALRQSVDALYEGRDLAWLASAPLPLRTILRARMAAIALNAGWLWLVLLGTMADALAVVFTPAALAIYPVIAAIALFAAAFSIVFAVLLRDVIGLRAMRTLVMLLSMVAGGSVFVGSQVRAMLSATQRAALWRGLHPHGAGVFAMFWWPARAAMGELAPLVACIATSFIVAGLAAGWVERRFARGGFDNIARRAVRRAASPPRFHAGAWRALLTKEWRLVWRTPGLVGRALYQGVYLLPVVIAALRDGSAIIIPVIAATPVFIGSELARLFMVTAMAGDQAPSLALSAPIPRRRVRTAKFVATAAGAATLAVPMALAIGWWRPAVLPVMLAGMLVAGSGALLLGEASVVQDRVIDLGARPGELFRGAVLGPVIGMAWALTTWFAIQGREMGLATAAAAIVLSLIVIKR